MTSSLGIAVCALSAAVLLGHVMQTVTQRKQYRCVSLSKPSPQPEEPGPESPRVPPRLVHTPSAVPSPSKTVRKSPRTTVPESRRTTVPESRRTTVPESRRTTVPRSPYAAATRSPYAAATRSSYAATATTRPQTAASKSPTDSFSLFRLPLQLISSLLSPLKHTVRQNTTSVFSPLISFNMPLTFSKSFYPSPINTNNPPGPCNPPASDTNNPPGPCNAPSIDTNNPPGPFNPPPSDTNNPPDPFNPPPSDTNIPPNPFDTPPSDKNHPPNPCDPPPGSANDPSNPCNSENPPVPCNPVPGNINPVAPVFPVKLLHGDFDDTVGLLCDILWNKFGYSCYDYTRDPERTATRDGPATNAPYENTTAAAAEHTSCETWTVVITPPTSSTPTDAAPPSVVGPPARKPCAPPPPRKPCPPPPARKPCPPPTPCKSGVSHGHRHGAVPGVARSHHAPSEDRPFPRVVFRPSPSEQSGNYRTSDDDVARPNPRRHDFLGVLTSLISSYHAPSAEPSTVNVRPYSHFK